MHAVKRTQSNGISHSDRAAQLQEAYPRVHGVCIRVRVCMCVCVFLHSWAHVWSMSVLKHSIQPTANEMYSCVESDQMPEVKGR